MYLVLILALAIVIAIGSVWSPIFALIIAVPLFVLFLAFVGLSRRADEEVAVPRANATPASGEEKDTGGIWGEERPEGQG